jgi:hypothetical protein
MSPPEGDTSLVAIEVLSLFRRARSVVPHVREQALESMHSRLAAAIVDKDEASMRMYEKALREVDRATQP